ncbi:hypothetical protein [Paractinoplanes durhamensis]|uniref:Glucose-6-phosphate isomerase n=1 Tax=Paractinoplanes durhamensis TaxID=113563 RepID=A0ABQ3Z1S1_9ACTN|nr:hypothetical protein [Actinoplanes durhamensis]GIE03767.1 hypothetical protein Adu01nite_51170 [Actinoplanes durhamensis]
MTAQQLGLDVSWYWDWVPADPAAAADWTASLATLLDEWVGAQVAAARAAWTEDGEFPFTAGEMGTAVARDLLERAAGLPANCRLIWGAGFVGDQPRWLPLLVLAEFRRARPEDPAYLMATVGAEGFPEDVREPAVDYVTTENGDGVRVVALARSEGEGLHGRVNAALRMEGPAGDIDVLLTTRVGGLDKLAVIGPAVEAVMHMIAADPPRFVPPAEEDPA